MRVILFTLLTLVSTANAIELSYEEATSYLKSKGCEFGAIKVYKGKPLGSNLKKGSLSSRAICAATISTRGAKKFCATRAIDFDNGQYYGDINVGSTRRVDGVCSLESLKKIYTKGRYPQIEAMLPKMWEWVVVVDEHGFSEFFLKATKGK